MGQFLKGVFSEADGTPSFSRIATAILVGFACGWVTHIVWHKHEMPDLLGLSAFITVLYGVNKIGVGLANKQ